VAGEAADEADVGAFRRLDRAHAAVVREVDVADLEARPLTGEAAGAEGREATTVGEARQRVHLVHELGELAGAEELLDGGDHRPGSLVDLEQRLGLGGGEVVVLLPLPLEEVEVADDLLEEPGVVLLVVAEGPEEGEHAAATLAGHAAAGRDVLARLLLDVELH